MNFSSKSKRYFSKLLSHLLGTEKGRCKTGKVISCPDHPCACSFNNNCISSCKAGGLCASEKWVLDEVLEKPDGPTLNTLPVGAKARVDRLFLPLSLKKRLLSLGLTAGTEVKVVNNKNGSMIIGVRDSRLGLSPEMSARITFEPAQSLKGGVAS